MSHEICQYCDKQFSIKSSLIHHQKTAKYCIEKQGHTQNNSYNCDFCNKMLTTKPRLTSHVKICKNKNTTTLESLVREKNAKLKDNEIYILKLEKMIETLQNTISDIAKQPKTTNNTNTNNSRNVVVNNTLDLSKERIANMIENHMTPNVVGQGQVGLALMTYEHLLKDENGNLIYKCVDPSRQIFEFTNKDGDVIKDVKADKLIGALAESKNLSQKTRENAEKLWTDENGNVDNDRFSAFVMKSSEIVNLKSENSKFRGMLASKTT